MREPSGYARKQRTGLVPYPYPAPRDRKGAARWWPKRQRHESEQDYNSRLAELAFRETPSANGYVRGHVWPRNAAPKEVTLYVDAKGCAHYRRAQ